MGSMNHLDNDATNVLNYDLYPQMVEGEKRSRRRRKKAKAEEGESKKRKLSDEQVKFLEINFGKEKKLESGRKMSLASELGLDPKQVAVWFQNRRARWKIKQLEEEYAKIKAQLDTTLMEKCHVENENTNMKRELDDVKEQLQMLTIENSKGGSPSSSSTGNYNSSFGEFGVPNDIMYINDQYNYFMDYCLF